MKKGKKKHLGVAAPLIFIVSKGGKIRTRRLQTLK
jgi:hypothetical protein